MRLPGTAWVGIFALSVGFLVVGPVYYWVNTRTLIPLDVPVSLAPGHIRTGDFHVNVEAYFSVQIRFPSSGDSECRYVDNLRTRQLTSIGTQTISAPGVPAGANGGITQGTYLGSFTGKPGQYNLDIEVLSPTQEFDHCQPRLLIEASPYDYYDWNSIMSDCFSFCVFCELLGASMLLVFATTRFRKQSFDELRLRIFETDAPSPAVLPADPRPERSIPFLRTFGIGAVVVGLVVFTTTKHWYDTRKFALVNIPVSLAKGHIKTGDFNASLKGTYNINFDTEVPSIDGCAQYAVLKTHWVVTRDGRVIAHRERSGNYWEAPDAPIEGMNLGSFDVNPGTYSLDVESLSDGGCLNVGNPRLRVYLSGFDRGEYDDLNAKLQLVSLLSVSVGLALVLASRFAGLRQSVRPMSLATVLPEQRPAWGITGLRGRPSQVRRGWAVNPVANVPTIALVCSLTWFVWLIPTWFLYASGRPTSHGLLVSLPRKGPSRAIAPGLTAPVIEIDAKRRVYVNYKLTSRENLPADLDQALRGLPVRVVYFDGDRDIPFMDAAHAIDIIKASGATAILITPDSKREILRALD